MKANTFGMTVLIGLFTIGLSATVLAQTQTQLTENQCDEFAKADQELNKVYQNLRTRHKDKQAFLAKLKTAQRQWLKFRDAELAARYPNVSESYGSAAPMCQCGVKARLTQARVKELKGLLEPMEGDVCAEGP